MGNRLHEKTRSFRKIVISYCQRHNNLQKQIWIVKNPGREYWKYDHAGKGFSHVPSQRRFRILCIQNLSDGAEDFCRDKGFHNKRMHLFGSGLNIRIKVSAGYN